jgi:hypothetical protein
MRISSKGHLRRALTAGLIIATAAAVGASAEPSKPEPGSGVAKAPASGAESVARTGAIKWNLVLRCSAGNCTKTFSAADPVTVIRHISCYARITGGTMIEMYMVGGSYLVDLGVQWERKLGTVTRYTFDKSTDLWLPPATDYKMSASYNGGRVNQIYCVLTGEYSS